MAVKVCIVGLTVSGNRGAESMLLSIMKHMREYAGECVFDLVSVYPEKDKNEELSSELRIVAGRPFTILALLPLSILIWPVRRLSFVRRLLSRVPVLDSFLSSDIVLDSGGVAFIDGRGFPLLVYNIALCYPAKLLGAKVVKLAQAMGPFKSPANRIAAGHVLKNLDYVIARGDITGEHLKDLNLRNTEVCADTAFAMPLSSADKEKAAEILSSFGESQKRWIGISPSVVVDDYCSKEGISYVKEMASFVKALVDKGYRVFLLPHSVRPGNTRMNNDVVVCQEILAELTASSDVFTLSDELRAGVLRELIGSMDFYVASRFHSMVSALSMKVPTLLIGWSHKYREVMRMFEMEEFAQSYSDVSSSKLIQSIEGLINSEAQTREKLERNLPGVIQSAKKNFEIATEVLGVDNTVQQSRKAAVG